MEFGVEDGMRAATVNIMDSRAILRLLRVDIILYTETGFMAPTKVRV